MGFGNATEEKGGLCHACLKEKTGKAKGEVGGVGFQPKKTGEVFICINPACTVGEQNIANQKK